jgi:hypothetical protein
LDDLEYYSAEFDKDESNVSQYNQGTISLEDLYKYYRPVNFKDKIYHTNVDESIDKKFPSGSWWKDRPSVQMASVKPSYYYVIEDDSSSAGHSIDVIWSNDFEELKGWVERIEAGELVPDVVPEMFQGPLSTFELEKYIEPLKFTDALGVADVDESLIDRINKLLGCTGKGFRVGSFEIRYGIIGMDLLQQFPVSTVADS